MSHGDFYLNSIVENVSFMNVRKMGGENFSQHTVNWISIKSKSIFQKILCIHVAQGITRFEALKFNPSGPEGGWNFTPPC